MRKPHDRTPKDLLREMHGEQRKFLDRIEPKRRRTTLAHYVQDPIRCSGLKDPEQIILYVEQALRERIACRPPAHDERQWLQCFRPHRAEAVHYVQWLLVWERLTKAEKDHYKRERYQHFLAERNQRPFDVNAWIDTIERSLNGLPYDMRS
jgi:hypothetical protein